MACRKWRKEYSSIGYDPDRFGVGSSSAAGDISNAGLTVPGFVPAGRARFLFRLASAVIPANQGARLLRYRLQAIIGQDILVTPPGDRWTYPLDREIVSPSWSFVDGNILYSLRWEPIQEDLLPPDATATLSTERGFKGAAAALLYETFDPGTLTYVPPAGGFPPGNELAGRGALYDQHGVWIDAQHLGVDVRGPGKVSLYAELLQTDPATRPYLPVAQYPLPAFVQGLRPEDQFLLGFGEPPGNNTKYKRIMGAFELEHVDLPPAPHE